jgi:predicted RNA-binding protein YlxR (DUF448 family)
MLAKVDHAELDTGPRASAPGTERFCVVTRTVKPVDELIRFVIGPDGAVVPDLKRKLPGRGIWITSSRATLAEAIRRNTFARGFRREVRVAPGLVAQTDALLERAALDALAIAGKAGLVVTGASRVEHAPAEGRIVGLVHASDAADDGVRKLDLALRRHLGAQAEKIPVIRAFTSAQLDLALARTNVVHAALLAGSASSTFLARCARLEGFRSENPGRRDANAPVGRKPEDRDLND